jgi:chromosomal replication initiator protein
MCENCFGEVRYDFLQDLDAQTVEAVVLRHFKVTAKQLHDRCRAPQLVHARMLAMWMVRRFTKLSYPQIGKLFHRHHTTVMSNCREIDQELEQREKIRVEVASLINELIESVPVQLRFPFLMSEVAHA